jgi:hypothetical protein
MLVLLVFFGSVVWWVSVTSASVLDGVDVTTVSMKFASGGIFDSDGLFEVIVSTRQAGGHLQLGSLIGDDPFELFL